LYPGRFSAGGYTIGFIRIADYAPSNSSTALSQFFGEIAYFQANTDGLIVDEMRNPGGSVLYVNQIAQFLIPYRFRSIAFEIRATSAWVESISQAIASARAQGAPQYNIDELQVILTTSAAPTVSTAANRSSPAVLHLDRYQSFYRLFRRASRLRQALMVLVDEFSASGGDAFAARFRTTKGHTLRMRTMGAGGNVNAYSVGSYTEGVTTLTESLMVRKNPVVTSDYPSRLTSRTSAFGRRSYPIT